MIKNFKLFESAKKALTKADVYTKLDKKQIAAFVKFLKSNKAWDSYDAEDLTSLENEIGLAAGVLIKMKITVADDAAVIKVIQSSWNKANESEQFKSDEDIENEFVDMEVEDFNMPGKYTNKMMGDIALKFPEGDESVGGGAQTVIEDFIFNANTNQFKLAFNNWFPEDIAMNIIEEVKKRLKQETGNEVEHIRFSEDWSDGSDNVA